MNLTDRRPSTDPWTAWPPDHLPLSADDACQAILNGLHREAREQGQLPDHDRKLIIMLSEGFAACAYAPDGTLRIQPTQLAMAKRFN